MKRVIQCENWCDACTVCLGGACCFAPKCGNTLSDPRAYWANM